MVSRFILHHVPKWNPVCLDWSACASIIIPCCAVQSLQLHLIMSWGFHENAHNKRFNACSIRHLAPAHCNKCPRSLTLDSSSVRHQLKETFLQIFRRFYPSNLHILDSSSVRYQLKETFLQIFRHFYHSNLHSLPPPSTTPLHTYTQNSRLIPCLFFHWLPSMFICCCLLYFNFICICIYILHPALLALI